MANINAYFQAEDEEWFDHPRLRRWRKFLQEGARLQLEVVRPRQGLDIGRAVFYVTIITNGQDLLEHEDWSDELNRGLIKLRVRALSHENEALRFGLAFAGAFEPAEDHVGDGFFNSVLKEELANGPLAEPLAEVLVQVHAPRPSHDSKSYSDCKELIIGAIRGRALDLTRELGYPEHEANMILSSALAIYLDERFSITDRRLLGFG